jgi:hypothetical protein
MKPSKVAVTAGGSVVAGELLADDDIDARIACVPLCLALHASLGKLIYQ